MYYLSSENKAADQPRGYREADLRLCFRLCGLLVFPRDGSYFCVRSLNAGNRTNDGPRGFSNVYTDGISPFH